MQLNEYNTWLENLKPFALTKNEDLKELLKQQGKEVYDFTLGDPKEPTPEFIQQALIRNLESISQYPVNKGNPILKKACASWAQERFQVNLNSNTELISSNGSKEAVFHIHQVLLNCASKKRIVVFPEPGYPVYSSGTILAGGVPYPNILTAEHNYIFQPESISDDIASQISAVWVSYPHNPTGATISYAQMEKIYNWALKYNIVLLSDECYVDMFYEGTTPPNSFLQVAQKNNFKNVLCFFSLSKRSGMTGYRSGFIAGDANIIELYAKYRLNVGLGTPDFIQHAAAAAWSETTHVLERNKIFAQKRKIVDDFFNRNKIVVLPSATTFYVWGNIPNAYSTGQEFANDVLKHTGIMLTPGEAFGNSCSKNFRLALVPTCDQIIECLKIWQEKINTGLLKI